MTDQNEVAQIRALLSNASIEMTCKDVDVLPEVAKLLPPGSDIFIALTDNFAMIWQQTVPTVRDTLAGFALAAVFGVGLASLLSFSRLLRDAIYPLIVVIQLVPKIE